MNYELHHNCINCTMIGLPAVVSTYCKSLNANSHNPKFAVRASAFPAQATAFQDGLGNSLHSKNKINLCFVNTSVVDRKDIENSSSNLTVDCSESQHQHTTAYHFACGDDVVFKRSNLLINFTTG
jgi:hypothetical protein